MTDANDSDHPIVGRPWEYEIRFFAYRFDPTNWLDSSIDLTLVRGDSVRRLRFTAPRELEIANGFPQFTNGLRILDLSGRRMENVGVRVDCFEMDGVISFWAKDARSRHHRRRIRFVVIDSIDCNMKCHAGNDIHVRLSGARVTTRDDGRSGSTSRKRQ